MDRKESYQIEFISYQKYEFLYKNSGSFKYLMDNTCGDLYSKYTIEGFYEKYRKLLSETSANKKIQITAKIYCYVEDGIYKGILTIHYYHWDLIAKQRCYIMNLDSEPTPYLEIVSFDELLINKPPQLQNVAEIATIWTDPSSRNKGIGTLLFNFSIKMIKSQLNIFDYYFIVAVSSINHDTSQKILNYVLNLENKTAKLVNSHNIHKRILLPKICDAVNIKMSDLNVDKNAKIIE